MLVQQDVVAQREHYDVVSYGGWALDLHPADGVYSEEPGCMQYHAKGIYQIPYRTLYSKNISNLFLAGRIISASHVAFASSRVMATCAALGQAVGMAAALCRQNNLLPRDIKEPPYIKELQTVLTRKGHYIPKLVITDTANLINKATISASSTCKLAEIPFDGPLIKLDFSAAQMLPVNGRVPAVTVVLYADGAEELEVQLRISSKVGNHTPDTILEKQMIRLKQGANEVAICFSAKTDQQQYVFICFLKNSRVALRGSNLRLTGILSVFNGVNKAVSNYGLQQPPQGLGLESFEFWCPQRRPAGHNIAMRISPAINCFSPENVASELARPVCEPNAWVADLQDKKPRLKLSWKDSQSIGKIIIAFDTDYDHPLESSLMHHPENVMPFCVRNYRILDGTGKIYYDKRGNYQSVNEIEFKEKINTKELILEVEHPADNVPAAIFAVRCFS
jgi:hypothetical protein